MTLLSALGAVNEIQYSPAECWHGCEDRDCPYTHHDAWFVGKKWVGSLAEDEAYVAFLRARAIRGGAEKRER